MDIGTLPKNARVTHLSLFDGSLQGFELVGQRVFCFQGHPEASPGPHDLDYLFDKFIGLMEEKDGTKGQVMKREYETTVTVVSPLFYLPFHRSYA